MAAWSTISSDQIGSHSTRRSCEIVYDLNHITGHGEAFLEQLADSMGAADLALTQEEIDGLSTVAHWEKSRTDREA